jgi:hypothetical protein
MEAMTDSSCQGDGHHILPVSRFQIGRLLESQEEMELILGELQEIFVVTDFLRVCPQGDFSHYTNLDSINFS